jgi:hypothetical protein
VRSCRRRLAEEEGRDTGPDGPLFFDPDGGEPTPLSADAWRDSLDEMTGKVDQNRLLIISQARRFRDSRQSRLTSRQPMLVAVAALPKTIVWVHVLPGLPAATGCYNR